MTYSLAERLEKLFEVGLQWFVEHRNRFFLFGVYEYFLPYIYPPIL